MLQKILLVDDDPDILEFLSYNITQAGYEIKTAENGLIAIEVLKKFKPDLIILDVMMPEMDRIETCQEIRKMSEFQNVIIAFLTARSEDYSQIAGFESGADDYITKPIKPKLFISKIKSLLRRNFATDDKNQMDSNNIFIDFERFVIVKNDEDIILPKKAFQILALLASKPDKVFSRDEIFDNVWGTNVYVGDRTIDVHIRKIRQELGEEFIKTIKGVGYKYLNVDNQD